MYSYYYVNRNGQGQGTFGLATKPFKLAWVICCVSDDRNICVDGPPGICHCKARFVRADRVSDDECPIGIRVGWRPCIAAATVAVLVAGVCGCCVMDDII